MDEDLKGQVNEKTLLNDEYYYRHIFKKTEKITSAVFYIVSKRQDIPADHVVRADLERRAKDTHSVALSLLNMEPDAAKFGMQTLLHSLISLESVLRLFAAMGGISEDNLNVMTAEVDGVQRSMRRYLGASSFSLAQFNIAPAPVARSVSRSTAVKSASQSVATGATETSTQSISRSDQIIQVLKDQDGIGIKDFHNVIYDCSEKTIQRELLSLIEKGLVRREGERRWSKYFLV